MTTRTLPSGALEDVLERLETLTRLFTEMNNAGDLHADDPESVDWYARRAMYFGAQLEQHVADLREVVMKGPLTLHDEIRRRIKPEPDPDDDGDGEALEEAA